MTSAPSPIDYPPHPCDVCGREFRGFMVRLPGQAQRHFCSMQCSEVYMQATKRDLPVTRSEAAALDAARKAVGAFLSDAGLIETPLADFTGEQAQQMVDAAVKAFTDSLAEQARAAVPF